MAERVFVYGSLKRGSIHHNEMDGAVFVREDELDGHYLVLYEGGYPALAAGEATHPVNGELYQVTDPLLARLDEFEQCPDLYSRSRVTLRSGERAWVYLIGKKEASPFPRIEGAWKANSVVE